jgi:hypothetical protein
MNGLNWSRITTDQFRQYLPYACMWVVEQERFILENGVPLTGPQLSDAKLARVSDPKRVRLLRVEQVPNPQHPGLRAAAEALKLITPATPGLALRYGIFIRSACWGLRQLVVHELAHTAQYERLGSIRAFLECFLFECVAIGYPSAPMEQEAIAVERQICGPSPSRGLALPTMQDLPTAKPPAKSRRSRR